MFLTRRNAFLLSAVSLAVLFFYTAGLSYEAISVGPVAFKNSVLPLLRQVLSERLPYRVWAPPIPAGSPSTESPTTDDHHETKEEAKFEDTRAKFTRHIVAVGDLHGDLPNARRVLQFSGVTDDKGDWSGDVDFFVQTGDIIDRGDDTIALFAWMDRLRGQASAVGGIVLSHLGNHEWMNAIGDWRYVYPSELATFGTIANRQKILSTGAIGRSWATNYTTASRLPLHAYLGPPNTPFPPSHAKHLHYQRDEDGAEIDIKAYYDEDEPLSHAALSFVHGGLSPTYPDLTPFPTRINEIAEGFLKKLQYRAQPPPHPPYPYPGLPHGTIQDEIHLYDSNGPVWYRGWALDDEAKVCTDVEKVLARTGTRRMIMGHTPDFDNIISRCNGKIIIIDTGISHAYGGVLSALSVHYTLEPVGNPIEKRWLETEVVSALYPDRRQVLVTDEREVIGDLDK
ncbi:Metallo-dependent phosphatase [Macrolepiota fuliginosa MF-IS2]|uniref:Metallo-dependent phosphatase n=1 Tax=Macrolepiota fuliginosa MF-IS2 TaxID=1400762 RepID=A0A9P5XC16_9AGAR|nr:Metallo-dependent phosphatase [Macrolepiota fuliginosa MF-IS2]